MSSGLELGNKVAIVAPLDWQLESRVTRGMPIPSDAFTQVTQACSGSSFVLVGHGVLRIGRRCMFQQQSSGTAVRGKGGSSTRE